MSKYKYNHDCPFEAYITNLGKYNEGELVGEWVKFPVNHKELQKVMKRIGVCNIDKHCQPYGEWFITDYDVYVDGLYDVLGEHESIAILNKLAFKLAEMDEYQYTKFLAILEEGSFSTSLDDVLEMIENIESFEVLKNVKNNYDLGYYYINDVGIYDLLILGNLSNYIDYEKLGKDISIEEGGSYTSRGYVVQRQFYKSTYCFDNSNHVVREKNFEYNSDVIYLCKLPSKEIIEKEFGRIVNDDVVLTKERIKHIEERRKNDADFIKIHLLETIKNYDYMLDAGNGCIKVIKQIDNNDNVVVIWLSLHNIEQANSVLTAERINARETRRLLSKNKVIDCKNNSIIIM